MDRFAALVKSGPLFIICQGNSTPYRSQKLNRKLRRRGEQSYFSLSTYLLQIGHFLHFPLGCLRLSWQLRTMWVTVEHFRSILRAGWAGREGDTRTWENVIVIQMRSPGYFLHPPPMHTVRNSTVRRRFSSNSSNFPSACDQPPLICCPRHQPRHPL